MRAEAGPSWPFAKSRKLKCATRQNITSRETVARPRLKNKKRISPRITYESSTCQEGRDSPMSRQKKEEEFGGAGDTNKRGTRF